MSKFLQVDVYVAPVIDAVTGMPEPSQQLWSPICCTLIQGPTSAVLVDTPTTAELTKGLIKWVKETAPGKSLRYIYTTHAHGDHFFGNPMILAEFPEAKSVATSFVVEGMKQFLADGLEKWNGLFPNGQIPDGQVVPEPLPENGEFSIDGHSLFGVNVAFSDTAASSFLHVPSLKLVVSGDIVYGECFQHLGEASTAERRRHWLDALDQIGALNPSIIVPGHKRPSQEDGPYMIELTREYIMFFEKELERLEDADELYKAMKKQYPNRWNDFILAFSCRNSVAEHLAAKSKA